MTDEPGLFWSDLLQKRLVVILGEAGIGKTFEFRTQVEKLNLSGTPAFFLALNQLTDQEAVDLLLEDHAQEFQHWLDSSDRGYFFLDAVDESRLKNPQALDRALRLVRKTLRPYINRTSLFISSRISDWNKPNVRDAIDQTLRAALVSAEPDEPSSPVLQAEELAPKHTNIEQSDIRLEAFCLDPLSEIDAKKFAQAHGVTAVSAFWRAVLEGGYEFMATRPLDLEWMARLWRTESKLGSYSDLIEAAVAERLKEYNPAYTDSGTVLSPTTLRKGVQDLAAACTFSGSTSISIDAAREASGSIDPADILPDWKPDERQNLLATAVFDESSYGRVKFHHRTVREYLSACWVERRVHEGLPISMALDLFVRTPFGEPVLIASRRAVLCWLTGRNATIREYVIKHFPEMLFYEGDPERWSLDDVVEAFAGYVKKLEAGYRPDWVHDTSELRRIARLLPPTLVSEYLVHHEDDLRVLDRLLLLVEYGPINVCAETVFSIYRRSDIDPETKDAALQTLVVVATTEQRACIARDLLSGVSQSNRTTGLALEVSGISRFTSKDLTEIFRRTDPESDFYGGLQEVIGHRILPGLVGPDTFLLMQALLAAVSPDTVSDLTGGGDFEDRTDRWMLSALPSVLLHALENTTDDSTAERSMLVDAALVIQRLRDSVLVNGGDLRSIREEIERRPGLRRELALAIAGNAEDIHSGIMELMPWFSGLVGFGSSDFDLLINAANSNDTPAEDRAFWFELAANLALYSSQGKLRREILDALVSGPDEERRRCHVAAIRSERIGRLRSRRQLRHDSLGERRKRRRGLAQTQELLLTRIEGIRNATDLGAIQWLVRYCAAKGTYQSYTQVDLEPVQINLGKPIADALSAGLTKVWTATDDPDPADHLDGSRPWSGLIGLAGLNHAVELGLDVQNLPPPLIELAVQLVIWDHEVVGSWLETLLQSHTEIAVGALLPLFESDIRQEAETNCTRWTMDFVLRGPEPLQRPILERAKVLLETNEIPAQSVQRKLLGAMTELTIAEPEFMINIAKRNLGDSDSGHTPTFVSGWFRIWASADLPDAWSWMERNYGQLAADSGGLAALASGALHDSDWARNLAGTQSETDTLLKIYQLLLPCVESDRSDAHRVSILRPQQRLAELTRSIPAILSSLPGMYAHRALVDLAEECATAPERHWMKEQIRRQAVGEAERGSVIPPADLSLLGEQYCRNPITEKNLLEQVLARLTEIRDAVENGPFSDRCLFEPGIAETKLQLWLAARLSDTPRRRFIPRFVVHREPQVDKDKRTDIEVSCAVGKVCIEIKPIDRTRTYTAASLTSTLSDQLVGQYLRGRNSGHGILVMFRLDDKKWKIPDGPNKGTFSDLTGYLQRQAEAIKRSQSGVEALRVFGIDCVASGGDDQ